MTMSKEDMTMKYAQIPHSGLKLSRVSVPPYSMSHSDLCHCALIQLTKVIVKSILLSFPPYWELSELYSGAI